MFFLRCFNSHIRPWLESAWSPMAKVGHFKAAPGVSSMGGQRQPSSKCIIHQLTCCLWAVGGVCHPAGLKLASVMQLWLSSSSDLLVPISTLANILLSDIISKETRIHLACGTPPLYRLQMFRNLSVMSCSFYTVHDISCSS